MLFRKVWSMPNRNTYKIKPIEQLINKYKFGFSIDPFSNTSKICSINNDIDTSCNADSNLDALEFLKSFNSSSVDFLLFDPPYSPRQVSEIYKKMKLTVNIKTTQSSFWSSLKKEISRILKLNGICISFGWNSNGIGKELGFEQIEILLISHGGNHNDTICAVEKMVYKQDELF